MKFVVSAESDGISVKNFLRKHCDVSARLLAELKRVPNGITANTKHIRSIDILHAGDIIELNFPKEESKIEAVNLEIKIAYEDEEIIVFDKPFHMPVHPVHDHQKDTLANAAAYHALKMGESYAFHAINRLDRDTSGLVLCAKNQYTAAFLPKNMSKVYFALCEGKLTGSGTINLPIKLKEGHTIQRETGKDGVPAVTHWKVIENFPEHTLVECHLETGRTHQIRVHFASIHHPLAGDDMYGGSLMYFQRQCLHCGEIQFLHPVKKQKIKLISKKEILNWRVKILK